MKKSSGKRKETGYGVMIHEQRILAKAPEEQQRRIIHKLTAEQALKYDADFEHWAHRNQLPPGGEGWSTWLMMAGRGFGKTRAGAEWIFRLAESRRDVRIALVGATIADARSVMIEGVSGLLSVARRYRRRLIWEPSLSRLRWPNGSEAQLFSGDNADGLRGPEHDFAWFLTFEVEADLAPVAIGTLLGDASAGAIVCTATDPLRGFAAYGGSIKQAIAPLVDCFGVELLDDGSTIRSPAPSASTVSANELGNGVETKPEPRYQRDQVPARNVPSTLRVSYYDADRDYQTGEARAAIGEQGGNEAQRELPAVLVASDAKALAQHMLARAWAERDTLQVRLPPARLGIEPGTQIDMPFSPSRWTVQRTTIDGFVVAVELRPSVGGMPTLPADGGRIAPNSDVVAGAVSIALLDIPTLSPSSPTLLLAASSPTPGWKRTRVDLSFSGQSMAVLTAGRKSVLGSALTVLAAGDPTVMDTTNSVDVQLIDPDQWLVSADDVALASGSNLALIGGELVQFGDVTPLGDGSFRLARLLRGRFGTETGISGHAVDELICLIEAGALQSISLPISSLGKVVTAQVPGGESVSLTVSARGDAIALPTGGATVDAEARTSIDQILATLRQNGLIGI